MSKKLNIVPDVAGIAREMTGKSQMMIVIGKLLKLSLINKIVFILNNIVFMPKLLKMDYAVGVKILCELEILSKKRRNEYVLHNQMVDMALGIRNKQVLENFFRLAKIYDFSPGLLTANYDMLMKMVGSIKTVPKNAKFYKLF